MLLSVNEKGIEEDKDVHEKMLGSMVVVKKVH